MKTKRVTISTDSKDEIYGSAYASAVYISSVIKLPKDKKVYVIGMTGIEEELREEGVSFIGGTVGFTRLLCRSTFHALSPGSSRLHSGAFFSCQLYS